MTRSVEEWIGKNDDQQAPPRVRVRVFERCQGSCGQCGRKIRAGESWTLEHLKALVNGGGNRESNLGVTCSWCLPEKNAADVAEKAIVARKRAKHLGTFKRSSNPVPGSRNTPWKRKLSGETVRRHPHD